ncbi:MAG: hypothetical protein AB7O66_17970 [Limisphaerales bacterium]
MAKGLDSLALAILVLGILTGGCSPPEQRHALARRELVLARLAEAAASSVPGATVLVVGNPFVDLPGSTSELREVQEASVRGVERGVVSHGGRFLGVTAPRLRSEALADPSSVAMPADATTPLSFMVEPGAWDRLRVDRPEANLWISLIGVPTDLAATKAWLEPAGPRWALFLPDLRLVGDRQAIRSAFERGRLVALVLARPGAPPESEPMLADVREEFARRYLLVTRENMDAVIGEWPGLFP